MNGKRYPTQKEINELYEYNSETGNKIYVTCMLPMPLMLNINNLNQIIELVSQQAETLSQLEYPDNNMEDVDTLRAIFKQEYTHFKLGNYIKTNELETIKARVDLKYHVSKKNTEEQ